MTTAGGGIHLVGSVPLPDAETVFRTVSGALNPFLRRITDGETGERGRWIWFQREMLLEHPDMEVDTDEPPYALYQWDGQLLRETPYVRFRAGVDPASSGVSHWLRRGGAGVVRAVHTGCRPTGSSGRTHGSRFRCPRRWRRRTCTSARARGDDYLSTYERSLLSALGEIVGSVPHDKLSIQWDVCQEVLIFEDYFPHRPDDYKDQVFAELGRLGQRRAGWRGTWATICATGRLETSTW